MPAETVIVCDDHPVLRSGVVAVLSADDRYQVVAEASNGESCKAKIKLFCPDIAIIDLSMPVIDGFQVLKWVGENGLKTRVFILSMHSDLAYVEQARNLGASGYLAKQDAESALRLALETAPGDFFTSESIGSGEAEKPPNITDHEFGNRLRLVSDAERKVLELLCDSLTSREIAEKLSISVRTVQAHRRSLSDKLGAAGHNRLLALAITHRDSILKGGAK